MLKDFFNETLQRMQILRIPQVTNFDEAGPESMWGLCTHKQTEDIGISSLDQGLVKWNAYILCLYASAE